MPMLEGQIDVVIGVDTHRDCHAAALLDPDGGVRATLEVPSDRAGHCPVSLDLGRPHLADLRRTRSGETPFSGLSH